MKKSQPISKSSPFSFTKISKFNEEKKINDFVFWKFLGN